MLSIVGVVPRLCSSSMMSLRPVSVAAFSSTAASLDFSSLSAKLTTQEGRAELSKLMKTRDDVFKMSNINVPSINFDQYRESISSKGVVDAFESSLKSMQIPEMANSMSATIEEAFSELIEEAKKNASNSASRVEELEQIVAAFNARTPSNLLTIEQALSESPQIAAEISHEISNDDWTIGESKEKE